MRLIVQRCARPEAEFRAWLRDDATGTQVELPGVYEVIGWAEQTVARMGWPLEVFVRWERGTVIFPRELVDVLPPGVRSVGDGRTVEGHV